jgi:hypothetical protein
MLKIIVATRENDDRLQNYLLTRKPVTLQLLPQYNLKLISMALHFATSDFAAVHKAQRKGR